MSLVLDGIRVLELGAGISGPMATMLLADHGADVTRIERPGEEPLREQLGHHAWNRGKRSAALDLKNADDLRSFLALATANPAVVCGIHRGLIAGSMEQFGETDTHVGLEPFVGPTTCVAHVTTRTPFRDRATPATASKEPT